MQRLPPSLDKVALRCNSSWSISNSLIASLLVQYVSNLDIVATSKVKLHNKRMAMEQVLCLNKVKCAMFASLKPCVNISPASGEPG